MFNDQISFTGRVGTAPEQRTLPTGLTITSFRVGSTRRRQDPRTREWVDAGTSWYTVSAYRRLAEHAASSIRVGDPVVVVGRLRITAWETATAKGTSVDVDAEAIGHDLTWGTSSFAGPRRADAASGSEPGPEHDDTGASWALPGEDGAAAREWQTASVPAADGPQAPSDADAPF